ncbi:MAG TPA: DUF1361 domain-containing protein [Gaiellaceae bacterium]|nr:DUF1361 domain-containing protein [Gaiellaceae bacterium]
MSDRRALALAALALASAFCIATLVARWAYSEPGAYRLLAWNLFLAWIPLVAAVGVYDLQRRGARIVKLLPLAAVWLLFLPNAPYLLTDLIHLGSRDDAPLWFDLVLFSAFAWTGALLGFLSVYLMQVVVRRMAGAAWSWALVGASLLASGFGIYLGRSLRWNSWDFVTRPDALLSDVWARLADPLAYPRSLGMTVALTALLSVLYLVLYAFAQLPAAERASR